MNIILYYRLINALKNRDTEFGEEIQTFIENSEERYVIKQLSEVFFYYQKYLPQNDRKSLLKEIFRYIDDALDNTAIYVYIMMHNDDDIPLYLGKSGTQSKRFKDHL